MGKQSHYRDLTFHAAGGEGGRLFGNFPNLGKEPSFLLKEKRHQSKLEEKTT